MFVIVFVLLPSNIYKKQTCQTMKTSVVRLFHSPITQKMFRVTKTE
jgi:hypothetical protein